MQNTIRRSFERTRRPIVLAYCCTADDQHELDEGHGKEQYYTRKSGLEEKEGKRLQCQKNKRFWDWTMPVPVAVWNIQRRTECLNYDEIAERSGEAIATGSRALDLNCKLS
jgi:hypothetical protein